MLDALGVAPRRPDEPYWAFLRRRVMAIERSLIASGFRPRGRSPFRHRKRGRR